MAFHHSPRIVTDGLVLYLDAANSKSYPGSGTNWYDLSGNKNDFVIDNNGFAYSGGGYFSMSGGGITHTGMTTNSLTATCVFWIKTTDNQSLFWTADPNSSAYFLGAYRVGSKFYNSRIGSPTFHMDCSQKTNIYDYLLDNNWHMVEFKSCNFLTNPWNMLYFSKYGSYTFTDGAISTIMIYDKNLTSSESLQNYNSIKGRFGL